MSRRDGGPAFPVPQRDTYDHPDGMTLRDWFAGQALPALIGNPEMVGAKAEDVVADAYFYADAMLKGRDR